MKIKSIGIILLTLVSLCANGQTEIPELNISITNFKTNGEFVKETKTIDDSISIISYNQILENDLIIKIYKIEGEHKSHKLKRLLAIEKESLQQMTIPEHAHNYISEISSNKSVQIAALNTPDGRTFYSGTYMRIIDELALRLFITDWDESSLNERLQMCDTIILE